MSETVSGAILSQYGATARSKLNNDHPGVRAVATAFGYSADELAAIPAATAKFKSVLAIAEAALKHEEKVTAQIHAIAKLARDEADFATGSFIQWFVDEQVEEIATMTRLVQAAKYAGENLLQLDNYVGRNMLGGD